MLIKASDAIENSGDTNSWKEFYSCNYGDDPTDPALVIMYRNNNGLESYWDYTTVSLNRAGTGYINNFTGNLVWVHEDIGFGGTRMPVSIRHVYNLNDANRNTYAQGYGWRTNYNQAIYQWSEDSSYYVWEDEDGTRHYFKYSAANTYKDEDGLELTLKTNGTSNDKKFYITDKNGNTSYFDSVGRLRYLENNQATKSTITISYTGTNTLLIDKIKDGAGRYYHFVYSNNLLERINYVGKGSTVLSYVRFIYNSTNLTQIRYPDNEYADYAYNSGHVLKLARDKDMCLYEMYFYDPTQSFQPRRVRRIYEFDGASIRGGILTLTYAHNQTTLVDANNNLEILQFNDFGNTVSIQDNEGRARYMQFAKNVRTDTGKDNQLRLSSKLQNTVGNRFPDPSFEHSTPLYAKTNSAGLTCNNTTGVRYMGNRAVTLSGTGIAGPSQATSIGAGQTYTFSAWIKTTGSAARLVMYNNGTYYATGETLPAGNDWTHLEVSYTNQTGASVTLYPCVENLGTSQTYVDNVQMEMASTASHTNLVTNGDFQLSNYCWQGAGYSYATGQGVAAPQLQGTVAKVTGDFNSQRRFSQTITIGGAAGDGYVFAGWAKGDSVPLPTAQSGENQRQFAILATFNYTDGTKGEFIAQFNPDCESANRWQYTANAMVATKAYSSITIALAYDYNANTAYFDGIQLYKEQFGCSYTYDANGNVTSVKDLQNNTTQYQYSNNNLTREILPTGVTWTYAYDNYHNVTTATSSAGQTYHFTYDTYGNNTGISITAGGLTSAAGATYSADGNRLTGCTDAAGNTTTYSYNENTNVLEWVQNPNDTAATRTKYSYDSVYRTTRVEKDVDANTTQSVAYSYVNDWLSTITTASTTYTIDKDVLRHPQSIRIGNRTLAQYSYTSDNNHDLQTLTYGNGDSVSYTYDSHRRVTQLQYEDNETVKYLYNNAGDLSTVIDSESGRTTRYYYDLIDRQSAYTETGDDFFHKVSYRYDGSNNLASWEESINGDKRTTTYTYDGDNRIQTVTTGATSVSYTYDAFGRVSQQVTKQGGTTILTEVFTYRTLPGNKVTSQIATHRTYSANYDVTYTYTYDNNGNILSVSDGTYTTTYVYDSANQLIRENNHQAGITQTWTYDDAGNILTHGNYGYSAGELPDEMEVMNYFYEDPDWGDLKTGTNSQIIVHDEIYGGEGMATISWDEIGNLISDCNPPLEWKHGTELTAIGDYEGIPWEFTYDANGMRISRSKGDTVYRYVYNGSKLSRMTVGEDTLDFT